MRKPIVMLVAGAVCLGACSGGDEAAVPTLELASTTITTAAPTTTTAPSTTVEETTTTVDPRIAEVEAAIDSYYAEQIRVLRDSGRSLDALEALVAPELFSTIEQNVLARRAEGRTSEGDFTLGAVSVELDSDSGIVAVACGIDGLRSLDPAGVVVVEADSTGFVRSYVFSRADDGRLVLNSIAFPGPEKTECDV